MLDEAALDAAVAADPDQVLGLLVDMASATDERLRALALRAATRVVLDRARRGLPRRAGVGRLRAVPADRGGDLDVDASIEAVTEARARRSAPAVDDLTARTWARPELALCLVVDASGSMHGERLAGAVVTAAACALRAPGDLAVLAFARTAQVIRPMRAQVPAAGIVQRLLRLQGHGVTSVDAALREASRQLEATRAARKVVLLLSDCRATDERDAAAVARGLEELVVIAPASDPDEAAAFARRVGARWFPLTGPAAAADVVRGALG